MTDTPTLADKVAAAASQAPTTGEPARSYGAMHRIVTHPAFRLGFLDAQAGRGLDHDRIVARMLAETPARAWTRMRLDPDSLRAPAAVELAQYRYEEGRQLVVQEGVRARAWGHPDFPPKAVLDFIWALAEKAPPPSPERLAEIARGAMARMRGDGLPLLAGAAA